ncbi:UNVERIFIED_CONTAM: hypothetical protein Sradi_6834300 [Sesamum radiatum]|uniref:Uncharacterized protein n=1 Tax=Sesamum radiatum TaxID=300843 RepID=A0AAW2JMR2_SESRA
MLGKPRLLLRREKDKMKTFSAWGRRHPGSFRGGPPKEEEKEDIRGKAPLVG